MLTWYQVRRWYHLLKILGKVVHNHDYSDEEISQLTWQERCRLIHSDPITVARHLDYHIKKLVYVAYKQYVTHR